MIDHHGAREVLMWCVIINYGALMLWFAVITLAADRVYELHRKWFPMSREAFNVIQYGAMAFYKLLILAFFLVPWLALLIRK